MRWVAAFLSAALLAGCSSPEASDGGDASSVTTFTDPSQGRLDMNDTGEHLHDYWNGQDELLVLDQVVHVGGLVWGGPSLPVAEFRPESGDVVPQGTSRVVVTVTWTDADMTNAYGGAELWVKNAADSEPQRIAAVEKGDTVEVESANERNDLPHQLLSAWTFQLVLLRDAASPNPFMMYSGDVTMTATAVRGLEIPLYPGHPDQWLGRTEIALLDIAGTMLFDGDSESGNFRCYADCPFYMVPDNGSVVPIDADHVSIVLERSNGANPLRMGVKSHSATSRDFEVPSQMERTPTVTTYTVPVDGGGDGPYAKQSQWEFLFYIDDPVEDFWVYEEYQLKVTAHKDPA